MQNRLATAILMSVGGSLAKMESSDIWSTADTGEFLESVSEITIRLLKGEVVTDIEGYPLMQLSGSNIAAQSYNDIAKEFLLNSEPATVEQEGYKE